VRKRTVLPSTSTRKAHGVRYPRALAQLAFQRARNEEKKRQPVTRSTTACGSCACSRARGSRALVGSGGRRRVGDVDWGRGRRRGSLVRRYFTSHIKVPCIRKPKVERGGRTRCARRCASPVRCRHRGSSRRWPTVRPPTRSSAKCSPIFNHTSSTRWISMGCRDQADQRRRRDVVRG
jgi:hypothetical protein